MDAALSSGLLAYQSATSHFAKAASRAGLADLKAVEGVSEGLAQKVYDFFHEKG